MAIWPALILTDLEAGKEWIMNGDRMAPYTIGRSSRCDFMVVDPQVRASVSSVHAMIEYDEDLQYWKITDLGSKEGTLVMKGFQVIL
jgi:pSer/pThr/pTyr-binding forkhead associated (FHA) protein